MLWRGISFSSSNKKRAGAHLPALWQKLPSKSVLLVDASVVKSKLYVGLAPDFHYNKLSLCFQMDCFTKDCTCRIANMLAHCWVWEYHSS